MKWTLKRLSRDPNLHMALLTAAALRKKTALSLQDRKNPLLKLLPFVSKVKRKAEFSIFFFTFRHVQHSLQRGYIALFFFHKCPTESSGGRFLGCPSFWMRLGQICPKLIKNFAFFLQMSNSVERWPILRVPIFLDQIGSHLSKIDQKLRYFFSTNVHQSREVANRVPIL